MKVLAETIEQLLPQTQCGACGFNGCAPYAQALAAGHTTHNRCQPGGERVQKALAHLLNQPELPLQKPQEQPLTARIDASACIGCAMCLKACPTGAIVGATKQIHSVIMADCTGCRLCIAPCPVVCITMEPNPAFSHVQQLNTAEKWAWEEQRAAEVGRLVKLTQSRKAERRAARLTRQAPAELMAIAAEPTVVEGAAVEKRLQNALPAETLAKIAQARAARRKKYDKTEEAKS